MFKAPVRETCAQCQQVVYPTEKMVLEGMVIHKICFTCKHCNRKLTVSNFAAVNGQIYCKTHYLALFKEHGGRYDKAFGAFQSGRNSSVQHDDPNKSTVSVNESDVNKSIVSEANKSVLDTTTVSEALETSKLSAAITEQGEVDSNDAASSVKARREAFEKKTSSFSSASQTAVAPKPVAASSSSPVKAMASSLDKKGPEPSSSSSSAPAPVVASGSVKNLMANLEKSNIVSKLGQAYAKPETSSTAVRSVSDAKTDAAAPVKLPGLNATLEPSVSLPGDESLTHATIARPVIPHKRRRPTVDKGLFTSPSQPQRKLLELDADDDKAEEEDFVVPADADLSAAFHPNSDIAVLKSVLSSAGGLFDKLEEKKRALQMLVQQKKQTIKMLKERSGGETTLPVEKENPNEGEEEDAEEDAKVAVEVADEDAFLAIKYEQEENLALAKVHHLRAFENATQSRKNSNTPLNGSNARAIAAFASFAVRNMMEELHENDDLVQQVSDAFDVLCDSSDADVISIKESAEAERAAFLFEVLGDTDEALQAFQRAHQLFPDDAEMLCNYAKFVNRVLAREAMEDGEAKQVQELKALAADLYREALDIIPDVPDVRANLAALLVQLSKMTADNKEESKRLLEEAKCNLDAAVEAKNPVVLYNLACVECLLGNVTECEKHLAEAVKANPGFREDIQHDPDLETVSGTSWFQALLKEG